MTTGPAGQKIVLFGNFGTGNLGNDATLQAILHNLRKYLPKAEVSCICPDPNSTELTHGIEAFPTRASFRRLFSGLREHDLARGRSRATATGPQQRSRSVGRIARLTVPLLEPYRWLRGLATLWGKDALIVPGTGVLTDAYGLFDWGPYDLLRWSVTAKLCRCKLFFVSVGAGPLYRRTGRIFAKSALSLADFRSYRDESSKHYLKGIGFRADRDPVYPDLAFSLPEEPASPGRDAKGRRLVVGLGLMEYAGKYSVERPTDATYTAYLETLVEFAKWLLARNYDIRLLIGDLADVRATMEFSALLKSRSVASDGKRIINEPVTCVEDLLRQIVSADLVVATRFHNVLLSLLLNKPTIAISFHHKCPSLMSQMGMSQYCQDINNLQAERLIEQFSQLQEEAHSLKRMITEKVKTCRDALGEQYGTIFRELYPESQRVPALATEIGRGTRSTVGDPGI